MTLPSFPEYSDRFPRAGAWRPAHDRTPARPSRARWRWLARGAAVLAGWAAPVTALSEGNVRVVDYGADMGSGYYRNTATPVKRSDLDVDGDGQTSDDSVSYWPFSLTEEMNPKGIHYDVEATNARFYGGCTAWFAASNRSLTEGMLNENHERRDDWNLMTVSTPKPPIRAAGFWFWQKADFLNGGDRYTVTFDADSRIVPHISRYFDGVEDGRWVVRNGTRFYVSEKRFAEYAAEIGRASLRRTSYVLHPLATRWAPYEPQEPYQIAFDAAAAVWENPVFDDVTAVGFLVYKDNLQPTLDVGVKWHSFEVFARVARPEAPSYYADLVTIPAGQHQGVPVASFAIGRTEVPYALWKRVWKWAVSSQYAFDLGVPGYTFDRDGDMGSMDAGTTRHTSAEPATDLTWHDAVLFCNALSELEGRRPVYYADAARTQVLREVVGRINPSDYSRTYAVYADWTADGFRLPTPFEWSYAALAGGESLAAGVDSAWTAANSGHRTQPVGQLAANAFGLRDTLGSVWEMTWDLPGDSHLPGTHLSRTVVGGDFRHPVDPAAAAFLAQGDAPWYGSPLVGLRIMRGTGQPPAGTAAAPGVPVWSYTASTVVPPASPAPDGGTVVGDQMVRLAGTSTWGQPEDDFYEDDNLSYLRGDGATVTVTPFHLARTETTFGQWNTVYQWALRNGYTFDWDGDLGSMDWTTEAAHEHGPDEPVTQVGWNDAVVWCNALSEYEGREPVYYSDAARTEVLRAPNRWRIGMDQRSEGGTVGSTQFMSVYVRWELDGYRLPTGAEWEIAYRAGNATAGDTAYPWNGGAGAVTAYSWVRSNSGGRTRPVGGLAANTYGLHDLAGNVTEWCWDWPGTDYYRPHNPKGSSQTGGLFGKMLRGASFGWEAYPIGTREEERESAPRAYFGFRVARCDAGEHPEEEVFQPPRVVDLDPAGFDLQQDRMFRYNNHRNGVTHHSGVPQGPVESRWTVALGAEVLSSPVVVDGRLYVGSADGWVYCLDAATGERRWRATANQGATVRPVHGSAAVSGGVVFIHAREYLLALDAVTGTERWRFTRGNSTAQISIAPAVAHGMVYTGFGQWSASGYSGLDLATGAERWRFRLGYTNGGPMGPTLDGLVFYAPYSDNKVMAAHLETEYYVWDSTGHHCRATLALAGDGTLFYLQRGDLKCLRQSNGTTVWLANLGGAFDDHPESGPAVGEIELAAGGTARRVYAGVMDGSFHCLDAGSGTRRWNLNLGGPVKSSPTLAANTIYIGTEDGRLLALDAETGAERWNFPTGARIVSSPWVADGVVYIANQAGQVLAVANPPPPLSFTSWADTAFPGGAGDPLAAPSADPDEDGLANFLEYALDGDPRVPDAALRLPRLQALGDDFSYRFRRDPRRVDVRYRVEASPDLRDWSAVLWDSSAQSDPNNDGDYHRLTVDRAVGTRFLRLTAAPQALP